MQETWVQLLSWETPSCPWRRAWQSFQYTIPVGSDGKESACNAGDLGLIPGLGRSPREGNGYPLQYSWLGAGASRQSRSGPENMHGAAEKENYSKLQQRWGREVQTRLLEGTQSDHDFIQHLIFIQESVRKTRQLAFFLVDLYILQKVTRNLESMGMAPCCYFLHQITFLCA